MSSGDAEVSCTGSGVGGEGRGKTMFGGGDGGIEEDIVLKGNEVSSKIASVAI